MTHDHQAFRRSAVSTIYADGGKEIRFGARAGCDMSKCDCTVYFCKHGVEHRDGLPMDWGTSPCGKCRQISNSLAS